VTSSSPSFQTCLVKRELDVGKMGKEIFPKVSREREQGVLSRSGLLTAAEEDFC